MRDKCARTPDQFPLTGTLSDSEREKNQSAEVSRIFSSQQENLCDRIVIRRKPVLTDRRRFPGLYERFASLEAEFFAEERRKRSVFSATSAWNSAASTVKLLIRYRVR